MSVKLSPVACVLLLAWALPACKPTPPPTDDPPQPQATALSDAVHAPLERAKAVEDKTRQAAQRQRAAIAAQAD